MKNFESDLKKLEELSSAIKQSDISLEDALKDFEEGIKLAKGMALVRFDVSIFTE